MRTTASASRFQGERQFSRRPARAIRPAGEWVRSFAIITTTPNELCAELHNRMPVVLGPETWPAWLGEDARQLKALLAPYPSEAMTCWPVSPRVGNVKNNDASLIEPVAGTR
jgi:putative SOS response-associated peptidase YedK